MMDSSPDSKGKTPLQSTGFEGIPLQDDLGLTLPPRSPSQEAASEATRVDRLLKADHDQPDSEDSLDSLFDDPVPDGAICALAVDDGLANPQWLTNAELNQALTDVNALANLLQASASIPAITTIHQNDHVSSRSRTWEERGDNGSPEPTGAKVMIPGRGPSKRSSPDLCSQAEKIQRSPPSNVKDAHETGSDHAEAGGECPESPTTKCPAKTMGHCLTLPSRGGICQPPDHGRPIDSNSETASVGFLPKRLSAFKISRSWTRHFPSAKSLTSRHSNHLIYGSAATSISWTALTTCKFSPTYTLHPTQAQLLAKISKLRQQKMSHSPLHFTFSDALANSGLVPFAPTPLTPEFPDSLSSNIFNGFNLGDAFGSNACQSFPGDDFEYFGDTEISLPDFDVPSTDQPEVPQCDVSSDLEAPLDTVSGPPALDAGTETTSSEISTRQPVHHASVPFDQFLVIKERLLALQDELKDARSEIKDLQTAVLNQSPGTDNDFTPSTPANTMNGSCHSSPTPAPARLTDSQKRLNKRLSNDNWRRRKAEKESLVAKYGKESTQYKAAVSRLQTRTGRISKAGGKSKKAGTKHLESAADGLEWAIEDRGFEKQGGNGEGAESGQMDQEADFYGTLLYSLVQDMQ